MTSTLPFSEAQIRATSTPESFRRGQEYWRAGAVGDLTRRGQLLHAAVAGSEPLPYDVSARLDAGGLAEAACTCLYGGGGWCKHIVATLLQALYAPETVRERPSLEQLLAPLSRDELLRLLAMLATQEPTLTTRIELLAPSLTDAPTVAPQVDIAGIRREAQAALHVLDRLSNSERYWRMGEIVGAERDVLAQAWSLIHAGDGRSALLALEALTDEYFQGWQYLQDDDGDLGAFFFELGTAWTEALLTADLPPAERVRWGPVLENWAKELDDYDTGYAFEAALLATEHGWDWSDLTDREPEYESVETWSGWQPPPTGVDGYVVARLNVLERQGRFAELLDYARLTASHERVALALARLGRPDEAADYALGQLRRAEQALTVAQALHGSGAPETALRVAEHGLTLAGQRAPLAVWTRELAAERGEPQRAVDAAAVAVREEPALDAWERARELAGAAWPALRDDLLGALRHVRRDQFKRSGAVDIFLTEGQHDDAIACVKGNDPYEDTELLLRVADGVATARPDWVSATGRRQAEAIADAGASAHYDLAAAWLARVRAADERLGHGAEWRAYLEALIETHRRKYKLRPLLEALRR